LVDTIIAADTELRAKAVILVSTRGIAKVTACAILTDMPELGHLSGKQVAELVGLGETRERWGCPEGRHIMAAFKRL
tara:strand:+ start:8451 stop:8681 length:231 start_codon:yes stop_codon:yes gene_type:complete